MPHSAALTGGLPVQRTLVGEHLSLKSPQMHPLLLLLNAPTLLQLLHAMAPCQAHHPFLLRVHLKKTAGLTGSLLALELLLELGIGAHAPPLQDV